MGHRHQISLQKSAQDLRAELIPVDVRIFSDGESRIKMGNVKKKTV